MDAIQKELESRKGEIKLGMKLLFDANFRITEWDVPEANEREVARLLLDQMQEALDDLKKEILSKNL
ncbi:MAG: hypothetical protein B6D59_05380 [Campylobacteraceae bacterium 4484_4]|nr:MAG: hypothetical protein B6D59_05380 [Campylobacteraceae bacterium 4484_4]